MLFGRRRIKVGLHPMVYTRIKRLLIGEPIASANMHEEKLPKWKALAVLSSDALSSVAYATEEMLIPLALVAVAAMAWSVPLALAVAVLLFIVTVSYRQTLDAYPQGGGAYSVARENLGEIPGLTAGAALLVGYVLTVAVSIAAAVAALTSVYPVLLEYRIGIAVAMIALLTVLNLRGVRESGNIFAIPTYFFIFSFVAMIVTGVFKFATGEHVAQAPVVPSPYPEITWFMLLRAFSSGSAALTGVEAITNGVTQFKTPSTRNAKTTMAWMSFILATFFLGVTTLAHVHAVAPVEGQTVIYQLARAVFGEKTLGFYLVQASTLLILFLAANTVYNGFPLLCNVIARDRYLPRQFASLGDKLVFSNGITGLSIMAIVLIVLFDGDTHALVPLYAIGVFLSFTLSQFGMVVRHSRSGKPGRMKSLLTNLLGGITTLIVTLIVAVTKFTSGAWITVAVLPVIVWMFMQIRNHYLAIGKELSLVGVAAPGKLDRMRHTVIIPISGIHRGVIDAVRYGISISDDVRACYVELDPEHTERVQAEWSKWAHEVPFVVLKSPYRSVIGPLIDYVNDVEQITHHELVTIIIPEFVTKRWWHALLHNQTAFLIRAALMFRKGKVVTSVRYHLKES